jgi:serine-threonine kinase receptor-associated protein
MEIAQDPSKKIMISKINWLSDTVLLAGCGDGVVRFWDINAGNVPKAPTHTIKTGDGAEIRDMEVNAMKQILTIGSGWKVSFFNLQDHSLIHVHKMPFHFKDEGGASLHPFGTKFVAGGSDLWVRVFDFETGEELESLKGHHGPIRCLRYAPDGKTYASGSEDGTIRLWKTEPEV